MMETANLQRVVYLVRLHYMQSAPLELLPQLGAHLRTMNALREAGCTTVGDMYQMPLRRFALQAKVGRHTLAEVEHIRRELESACRDGLQ